MLKHLKATLTDYIHALSMYDYVAFGWLFVLLTMMIITALLSSKRKPKLASFLIFVSVILMFTAPIAIKIFLDKTVRKVEITDQNSTFLNFSKALVVTGKLQNLGKTDMHRCYVKTKILKHTDNKYLNILYNLKPLRERTTILDRNLTQNSLEDFKVVFENFNNKKDYSISLSAECY